MGQNLTGQTIASTYEDLVQISGSSRNILTDGTGSEITNLQVTSSFATTASFALNVTPTNTGSLMVTGSVLSNVLTFTKGDGSTFNLTVATGSAVTVNTGSLMVTGSVSLNTLTFTKGDGSTFNLTVDTGSAVTTDTGSLLVTASISDATTTYTKGDGSTFALTTNNVNNAISASYAATASYALNVPTINTGSLMLTGSVNLNTLTFTKADGSTFDLIVNTGSASTVDTGSLMATGSVAGNVLTFTKGDGSTFNLTVDTGSGGGPAFPYTGSAGITGSLDLIGSFTATIPSGSVLDIRSTGGPASNWGPDVIIMGNYSGSNVAISKTSVNSYNNIIIGAGSNNTPNRIISSSLDGNTLIGGASNRITGRAQRGTIVGGFGNQIASGSDLGGSATIQNSGIFAGSSNQIFHGSANFIGGGSSNTIVSSSFDTTPSQNVIIGGQFNQITGSDSSALVGGLRNRITDASLSVIIAGTGSVVTGTQSAVIAGRNHTVSHSASVIVGGNNLSTTQDNEVVVPNLTISGSGNVLKFADGTTQSTAATGGGSAFPYTGSAVITGSLAVTGSISTTGTIELTGTNKWINSVASGAPSAGQATIAVASGNPTINANAIASGIFAATNATLGASAYQAFVIGGDQNDATALRSGVAGGYNNNVTAGNSYIFGGGYNDITGGSLFQTILGGDNFNITAGTDVVGIGGLNNTISGGSYNAILAGSGNTNNQNNSVIIGGQNITAIAANTVYVPNLQVTGSATVQGNLTVTGSIVGTITNATSASFATTASYALTAGTATSATTATTASYYNLSAVTQNAVFSGSVRGDVSALSITSNTASLDLSTGNFFTIQLVGGTNTYINPTNIQPGQTVNIRVNTTGSATVSFPTSVLQVSGSSYVPTTTTAVDIITLISFDSSNLMLASVKNLV